MKVAIYARVSTEEQTTDNQLFELREYCKRHNYEVYMEYSDVISGSKDSRPHLDQLMQDARQKYFDAVIIWKLDRLGRSLQHLINITREWENKGINLICTTQNIDTTTPHGRLFFYLMGALAEFERELIKERTILGLRRARKEGKRLGRPTISKYHKETIIKAYQEGKSINRIAKELKGISYGAVWKVINNHKTPPTKNALISDKNGGIEKHPFNDKGN